MVLQIKVISFFIWLYFIWQTRRPTLHDPIGQNG